MWFTLGSPGAVPGHKEVQMDTSAVTFGGGGRGQTAQLLHRGVLLTGKGTSRAAALADLEARVKDNTPAFPKGQPARVTLDEALTQLQRAHKGEIAVKDASTAPEERPDTVWSGKRITTLYPCSGECLVSEAPTCKCDCQGRNHGLIHAVIGGVRPNPVVLGPKECACGCGGITQRKYVPGHDARHHAAIKAAAKAATGGGPRALD